MRRDHCSAARNGKRSVGSRVREPRTMRGRSGFGDIEARKERGNRMSKSGKGSQLKMRILYFIARGSSEHNGEIRCAVPWCQEIRPERLEIDHINGGGGIHREKLPKGKHSGSDCRSVWKWILKHGDPEDYRLLCESHNKSRKFDGYRFNQARSSAEHIYLPGIAPLFVMQETKILSLGLPDRKLDLSKPIDSDPPGVQLTICDLTRAQRKEENDRIE